MKYETWRRGRGSDRDILCLDGYTGRETGERCIDQITLHSFHSVQVNQLAKFARESVPGLRHKGREREEEGKE